MALKVATLNANGLRDLNKRMGVLQWLSHFSFDMVCLQESHVLSVEEYRGWFSCYGYLVAASCGTNRSCGTVILFRPIFSLISSSIGSAGRFVCCKFLFRDKKFRVVSLYAPNANPQRDEFFAYMFLPWWIPLCQLCCVETSMQSLIGMWTVSALPRFTLPWIALSP